MLASLEIGKNSSLSKNQPINRKHRGKVMVDNWKQRKRPARFERRIEFDNYDLTREFLDLTAEISEKEGFYPDMNFGPKHVSMTIHTDENNGELEESQLRFINAVNKFAPASDKIKATISTDYDSEEH